VASGVVAYDLPGSAGARILWGTGRGSNRRAGVAAAEEGFSIRAAPDALAIKPGASAVITLDLVPGEGAGGPVALSATVAPAGPTVSLSAGSATPPAAPTITVTDNHPSGPLQPGILYTITVTATGDGRTRTLKIPVLVGGSRVMLPLVAH